MHKQILIMEKDTVILSLEKYNELRDFKIEVLKGKVVSLSLSHGLSYNHTFYTESEAIEKAKNINKEILQRSIELGDSLNKMKNKLDEAIKISSWFEFKEWQRNNK